MSSLIESAATQAARSINRDLLRAFGGNAERAAEAVEELAANPKVMEAWASRMIREHDERALEREYEQYRVMVDQNMQKSAEDYVEGRDWNWLSAWYEREKEALKHVKPFRWEELPTGIRHQSYRTMAMAYLVATNRADDEEE